MMSEGIIRPTSVEFFDFRPSLAKNLDFRPILYFFRPLFDFFPDVEHSIRIIPGSVLGFDFHPDFFHKQTLSLSLIKTRVIPFRDDQWNVLHGLKNYEISPYPFKIRPPDFFHVFLLTFSLVLI